MDGVLDKAPVAPTTRWIVGRRYDLLWFFGGMGVSLAFVGLALGAGVSIVVLWWTWVLFFDGPHIAAAFTRTYVDREEWRKRRGVLIISLLLFAVGPACLGLNLLTGSEDPFLLFLGLAALIGYYHIIRQHYGFLALYKARNRDFNRVDLHVDRWFLYVTGWTPYLYFLFTHPRARAMLNLPADEPPGLFERAVVVGLLVLWGAAVVVFLVRLASRFRERIRQPHVSYLLLTAALIAFAHFFIARFEPVYSQTRGPDEDFLLLSILLTAFHNVQYLGLVWFHNRNRYGSGGGDFGAASRLNRTVLRFLAACFLFSLVVYSFSASATGVFPGFQLFVDGRLGPFSATQLGLCFWWGLGLNHYYLDQKIWRIRGDEALKKNLALV